MTPKLAEGSFRARRGPQPAAPLQLKDKISSSSVKTLPQDFLSVAMNDTAMKLVKTAQDNATVDEVLALPGFFPPWLKQRNSKQMEIYKQEKWLAR